MRISALIIRLWGDVAAQPLALFIVALIVMMLAVLAAVGLVVAEHRIERWVRPRLRRCVERRRTVW
ncbi:MAG: hypothetical protein ACRDSS_08410, partial [Actinocrinis sp.]